MTRKWYTCTPVSFKGDDTFFCRDSGLLCRGLQDMGFESRAIMPYPAQSGDKGDVLRTEYRNLCDAQWWGNLELDGVLLYAWADPRYNGIVRAIRKAGIRLFVSLDSDGIISPFSAFFSYIFYQYDRLRFSHSAPMAVAGAMCKVALRLCALFMIDLRRMKHLEQADLIGVVSPIATERIRCYCHRMGYGRIIADRIKFIPHPISQQASYAGEAKNPSVLFVGRWDDRYQKNTELLIEALKESIRRNVQAHFYIAGRGFAPLLAALNAGYPDTREKITYYDFMSHEELLGLMRHCQVVGGTSRYESFHLVSAEGLCCGCSIVGPSRASTPSFPYFISHNSGTLARTYTATGFVDAIEEEIRLWKCGKRSAEAISAHWTGQLHVGHVLSTILSHMK